MASARPERPKATKVYPSLNGTDISTNNEHEAYETAGIRFKETNTSNHVITDSGKTTDKTRISLLKDTGTEKQKSSVPKGFVPRSLMVAKLIDRKQRNGTGQPSGNKRISTVTPKGLPVGFVSRADMAQRSEERKNLTNRGAQTGTKKTQLSHKGNISRMPEAKWDSPKEKQSDLRINSSQTTNRKHIYAEESKENVSPDKIVEGIRVTEHKGVQMKLPVTSNTGSTISTTIRPNVSRNSYHLSTVQTQTKYTDLCSDHAEQTFEDLAEVKRLSKLKQQPTLTKSFKSVDSVRAGTKRITRSTSKTASSSQPTALLKTSTAAKTAQLSSVKMLIMNANGKDDKGGTPTDRRKNAISNVISNHLPHVVLFQEFSWTGITGKTWSKWPIPDNYVYKGHYDASIMYDQKSVLVNDLPATDIDSIIKGLQSNAVNRLKRTFPMDFDPIARMKMAHITAQTKPVLDFICVSWHGRWTMSQLKRIVFFQYLMEFLRIVKEKYKIPILVGGDFNIDMYSIEQFVKPPFKLCIYEASMRRTAKGIKDYFIITEEMDLNDISWVNLERDTAVFRPNGILDHDPVVAELMPSASASGVGAMGIGKRKSGTFSSKISSL